MRLADRQVHFKRGSARRQPLSGRLRACFLALAALLAPLALTGSAAASPGEIVQFALPNRGQAIAITAGPDGNLWFTVLELKGERRTLIDRITPSGQITEFPQAKPTVSPEAITAGPDGNLWFTAEGAVIGRLTPSGELTTFPVPVGVYPDGITAGPDGNMWFVEPRDRGTGAIGRITPSGQVTEFPPPGEGHRPEQIAAGPDGNLWFTETTATFSGAPIGRITTSGQVTEFPTGGGVQLGITAGPDGNLWFTQLALHNIGRITPDGTITTFPSQDVNYRAGDITAGPDGNLWFTGAIDHKRPTPPLIGRITLSGQVSTFALPHNGFENALGGITAGPDGNLWFAEETQGPVDAGGIGRITPGLPAIEIASAEAKVHRRWAKLKLSCGGGAAGSACSGTLRLRTWVRRHPPSRGTKTIGLGHRRYTLAMGAARPIALRLNSKALALLSRHRRRRVTAIVTVAGGQGATREIVLKRATR